MNYDTFIDHITAEGCAYKSQFDVLGSYQAYQLYHNMASGKSAYLKERDGQTIPWEAALLFCQDIGIDPPADLIDKLDQFKELGLTHL